MERSETSLGTLFIWFSMGIVTSRSTSSAACPGNKVMTWTDIFETSGKASTGKRWKALMPARMNSTNTAKTIARCRRV